MKKLTALFLALVMTLSLCTVTAFADGISTVADVLATVDGFPTRPAGAGTTVPENAWKNASGDILYSWAGDLEFVDTTGPYFEIRNSPAVTEDNGNYKYTISGDGWEKTITFNMENGVLVSVNVVNTLDHISEGLYTAPAATYTVTVDNTTQHGTVTATPNTDVASGTNVTLTVTPENGYKLDSLTVTKKGGGTVEVTDNKFTMPDDDVTVTATFAVKSTPHHHSSTTTTPTVSAPQTADAGIAIYGVLSVSSLLGMGWVSKKKR